MEDNRDEKQKRRVHKESVVIDNKYELQQNDLLFVVKDIEESEVFSLGRLFKVCGYELITEYGDNSNDEYQKGDIIVSLTPVEKPSETIEPELRTLEPFITSKTIRVIPETSVRLD